MQGKDERKIHGKQRAYKTGQQIYDYCVFPLKNAFSPKRDLCSMLFGGADTTTSDTENPMRVSLLALAICLVMGGWIDGGTASMKLSSMGAVVERERGTCVTSNSFELGFGVQEWAKAGAVCGRSGDSTIVISGSGLEN